jgi:hypothetical protein
MFWIFAAACLTGFCAASRVGAAGLGTLAFLAILAELLAGWFGSLPLWANIGMAFLVSGALQLSYLLGLLSAAMGRQVMALFKIKQRKARMAVAEAGLSCQPPCDPRAG